MIFKQHWAFFHSHKVNSLLLVSFCDRRRLLFLLSLLFYTFFAQSLLLCCFSGITLCCVFSPPIWVSKVNISQFNTILTRNTPKKTRTLILCRFISVKKWIGEENTFFLLSMKLLEMFRIFYDLFTTCIFRIVRLSADFPISTFR